MRRAFALVLAGLFALPVVAGDFEDEVSYQGRPLRDWLADIRTGDQEARLRASRVLRLVGPEADGSTAALLMALKSDFQPDDLFVRTRLGFALARLGPKQVPVLAAALGMENDQLAFGATRALGRLGPQAKPAARHLARLMKSSTSSRTRTVAALALWHVERNPAALEPLRKSLTATSAYDRMWAAWAVEQLGPAAAPAVPELIAQLAEDDDGVRRYVFSALEAIGEPAVAPLVKATDAKQTRQSVEAIEALGRLGPHADAALPALLAISDKGTPGQRAAAARALGKIGQGSDEVIGSLRKSLADADGDIRREAARALRSLGTRAAPAAGALCQALRDPVTATRQAAATALVRIGKPAVSPLTDLLRDKDELVRRQALDCLRDIGPDAVDARDRLMMMAKTPDDYLRPRAVAALAALGKPASEGLLALLADDTIRADVLAALVRVAPEGAPKALLDLLARIEPAKQADLVRALGHLDSADAVAPLSKLYEEERLRVAILAAFAHMPGTAKDWVAVARKGLSDDAVAVRLAALAALAAAGPDAKPAIDDLAARLKDDSATVRQAAGQRLIVLGEAKRVVPAVEAMLASEDRTLRQTALHLAAWLGPEAKPLLAALREQLKEKNADLRLAAVAALLAIDPDEDSVVSPLLTFAGSKDRHASRPVLFRLLARSRAAGERVVPLLTDLVRAEGDWPTRIEAARTLGTIGEAAKEAVPALMQMLLDVERMPDMISAEARDLIVLNRSKEIAVPQALGRDEPDLHRPLDRAVTTVRTDGHEAMDTLEDALVNLRDRYQGEILTALAGIGAAAVPELAKWLRDDSNERRALAARAAEALGEQAKGLQADLRTACGDADSEVAVPAARALLTAGGDNEVSLPVLQRGLDAPGMTAVRAAHALAVLGPAAKSSVDALRIAAGSRYAKLRYEAVRALAACDSKAVRATLERRLRDSNRAVRVAAAVGLRKLGDHDPLATLIDALREGTVQARLDAIAALADLKDKTKPATPALAALLTDRAAPVRMAAARLLNDLAPSREASEALLAVATSTTAQPATRVEAIQALRPSLTGRARAAVAALAHEPSVPDAVRAAAR